MERYLERTVTDALQTMEEDLGVRWRRDDDDDDDERFICDVSRSEFKPMTDEQWHELKEYCKSGFSGGIDNAIMDLEIEIKGGHEPEEGEEEEPNPDRPVPSLAPAGEGEEAEEEEEDGVVFHVLVKDAESTKASRGPMRSVDPVADCKVHNCPLYPF